MMVFMQNSVSSWEPSDLEEPVSEEDEALISDEAPKSAFELNVEKAIAALGFMPYPAMPYPAASETSLLEEVRVELLGPI
jgi:hypothetical protein